MGNGNQLILLNPLNIRSEIWQWSLSESTPEIKWNMRQFKSTQGTNVVQTLLPQGTNGVQIQL